ncbi:hypothetical protein AA309_23805 [Microvirga vignae]|uniref:Uncharacterized protein n=1 Tax=Microvirga vignae TaxID=1225564 RepID=A0A0H1R6P1_9HYPH|nr:hypothetical protein [Microvirga vignae]KLK90739.1 hypothetical protein AA309_23805 [Microvirga vignae]
MFLARAFHRIGQARYGEDWTGYEPHTPTYRASTFSIFDLVKKSHDELTSEEQEWLAGTARDRKAAEADPEGFAAVLQARHKARQQEESLAEQRAAAVQIEIITRCEAGDLISAWRPATGGKMEPTPAHYWNGAVQGRFDSCTMSMTNPFPPFLANHQIGFIFLEQASLERFLLSQPFAEKPSGLDIHLSPYLQVLVSIARKMQITPGNQPKKEAIMEEIKLAWTGQEPLGKTLVEYMATILREPESQLGRGNKKKSEIG